MWHRACPGVCLREDADAPRERPGLPGTPPAGPVAVSRNPGCGAIHATIPRVRTGRWGGFPGGCLLGPGLTPWGGDLGPRIRRGAGIPRRLRISARRAEQAAAGCVLRRRVMGGPGRHGRWRAKEGPGPGRAPPSPGAVCPSGADLARQCGSLATNCPDECTGRRCRARV